VRPILTTHAGERMTERHVTMEQIVYVLQNPDVKIDTRRTIARERTLLDGRRLKVVLVKDHPVRPVIKTVIWPRHEGSEDE
jgi:hypothetical protein